MGVKSTEIITRKRAKYLLTEYLQQEALKMLEPVVNNLTNKILEQRLEEMEIAKGNNYTNYVVNDGSDE